MTMRVFLTTGLLALLPAWVAAESVPLTTLNTEWWAAFRNPGLTAAIEQGLAAHPDTESALARVRAAEAGIALARAERRPELGLEAGYRQGREQTVRTGSVEDDVAPLFGTARLSWELDLFGRAQAGINAASARAGQSKAHLAGVRLILSLEIARVYVDLARLNEQVAINETEVDDTLTIYQRTERRTAAGLDPDTSRSLALAARQKAEHQLMQTEIERDRIRARLTSLVGGTPIDVEPTQLDHFTLPPRRELAATDSLLRRPDVVNAHLAWMESKGEVTAAARARLPTVALVVSAAGEGSESGNSEQWSAWAGPVLSLPIWNPGLKSQSALTRSNERAAEAALRAMSLRAVEEIDRAWAERSSSEEMIGHMNSRRTALESVAQTETRKRAAGLIQEDALRRARLTAAEATRAELIWRAAALQAHLTLIAALGG